jgi:hypothetical protein
MARGPRELTFPLAWDETHAACQTHGLLVERRIAARIAASVSKSGYDARASVFKLISREIALGRNQLRAATSGRNNAGKAWTSGASTRFIRVDVERPPDTKVVGRKGLLVLRPFEYTRNSRIDGALAAKSRFTDSCRSFRDLVRR